MLPIFVEIKIQLQIPMTFQDIIYMDATYFDIKDYNHWITY